MTAFFIAGTDTGVGKTWVSSAILRAASAKKLSALGLKPVAAGADVAFQDGIENEDAVALHAASNVDIPIRQLNPVCLPDPLSPHIAAERAGVSLTVDGLMSKMSAQLAFCHDLTLVEGAGGWRVPISHTETMADFAKALNLPVILIVGMRLGCLNHALLTVEAIQRDGLRLHGWIANELSEDMSAIEENVATLKRHIEAPMLSRVAYCRHSDTELAASAIDINKICESHIA